MPRLPVKKLRKQLKLLLLLALLTSAAWFTYLHISLVRQGRALRLPFAYGKGNGDGGSPAALGAWPRGALGVPKGWWVPPATPGYRSTWGLGAPRGCRGSPPHCTLRTPGFGGPQGI